MRRRPVLGAVSGFCLGLFVAADLFFLSVIPFDSAVVSVAPLAGLVVGLALGLRPRGRGRAAST
jgi:hypothetical protein